MPGKKISSLTELAELLVNGGLKRAVIGRGVPAQYVEDVLQDTFFEMMTRLDTIDDPRQYAITTAWHKYLERVRRPAPEELPTEIVDSTSSPEAQAIADEQIQAVMAAVERLPPQLRKYARLFFKDKTDEEIRQAMGEISATNLRVIGHRTQKTLARLLRGEE